MQIPRPGKNIFGIRHYSKKHSDGNDQNRQYPNLASTQKHKRFIKTVGVHGILPEHDTKIRRMDIINDRPFAKKTKNLNGVRTRC